MTGQVDFYVLEGADAPDARQRLACRVAEKAWRRGARVYVRLDTPAEAQRFDELLWTFAQNSFVPHGLVSGDEEEDRGQPVLIGHGEGPAWCDEVLIALTADIPGGWERYRRIAECVAGGPGEIAAGRARFRRYRELGLEPQAHKIR